MIIILSARSKHIHNVQRIIACSHQDQPWLQSKAQSQNPSQTKHIYNILISYYFHSFYFTLQTCHPITIGTTVEYVRRQQYWTPLPIRSIVAISYARISPTYISFGACTALLTILTFKVCLFYMLKKKKNNKKISVSQIISYIIPYGALGGKLKIEIRESYLLLFKTQCVRDGAPASMLLAYNHEIGYTHSDGIYMYLYLVVYIHITTPNPNVSHLRFHRLVCSAIAKGEKMKEHKQDKENKTENEKENKAKTITTMQLFEIQFSSWLFFWPHLFCFIKTLNILY